MKLNSEHLLVKVSICVDRLKNYYHLDLDIAVSYCRDNSVLGSWNSKTNTLSLNKKWALNQDWISIEAVIRHEMAHAIVSQILLKNNEHADRSHGSMFRHACSMIGYNPTLHSIVETEEDTRIRKKIEKLLSLAESANQNEASLAMQRANELALRHSITEMNSTEPDFYVEIPKTSMFNGRKKSALIEIAHFCMNNYNIRVIWTSTITEDGIRVRCVEFMGTRHIVEQASYAFDFLLRTGTRFYQEYKKQTSEKNTAIRNHGG